VVKGGRALYLCGATGRGSRRRVDRPRGPERWPLIGVSRQPMAHATVGERRSHGNVNADIGRLNGLDCVLPRAAPDLVWRPAYDCERTE